MPIGDSVTVGGTGTPGYNGYRYELIQGLLGTANWDSVGETWDLAVNGTNTNAIRLVIDSQISIHSERNGYQKPNWILYGLGVNDLPGIRSGSITQVSWLADTRYTLDALHAAYPAAQVLISRVYQSDYTAEQDLLDDVWIPLAISGRESFVSLGPDNRTYLPGNMTDAAHPNPAGYTLMADAWQTAMGY